MASTGRVTGMLRQFPHRLNRGRIHRTNTAPSDTQTTDCHLGPPDFLDGCVSECVLVSSEWLLLISESETSLIYKTQCVSYPTIWNQGFTVPEGQRAVADV
jgi:hypothetical protein